MPKRTSSGRSWSLSSVAETSSAPSPRSVYVLTYDAFQTGSRCRAVTTASCGSTLLDVDRFEPTIRRGGFPEIGIVVDAAADFVVVQCPPEIRPQRLDASSRSPAAMICRSSPVRVSNT